MELWIPLTIAAAFLQNIRSVLQKHLTGNLSTLGSAYVRFLYGLPVALVYFIVLVSIENQPLPRVNLEFLICVLLGGICQVLFTVFLLWLFSFHNFAVGTTLTKLETVMVALFGLILLEDDLTLAVMAAISTSTLGLVVMSVDRTKLTRDNLFTGLWRLPTIIGFGCAAWLGLTVVFFRTASLSLNLNNYLLSAAFTLLVVLILQSGIMGIIIHRREPGQFTRVITQWRPAALVGISGALASIGWFSAFTLQNATYVRALGQIELLFTFIATLFFFREKVSRTEVVGITLITASITMILMAGR